MGEEWEHGYQQGWNDNRERDRLILEAINNPTLNDVQLKLLKDIISQLLNNGATDDEEMDL